MVEFINNIYVYIVMMLILKKNYDSVYYVCICVQIIINAKIIKTNRNGKLVQFS